MGLDTAVPEDSSTNVAADGASRLATFLATVPLLDRFRDGVNSASYETVPHDWLIGTTDVVGSTEAIQNGNYKTVNMIGAGVIAAAMNRIGSREFPFVFGGDGATFVVPPEWEQEARDALAAMRRWASDETDLSLRAALVPVGKAAEAGHDVRLARFAPSPNVNYAMFAGGGLAWAEREMKAGQYEVPRAPQGIRPDLEGLSCRWQPAEASKGEIVSLIVVPGPNGDLAASDGKANFEVLERRVLECLNATGNDAGHPLTRRNVRFALMSRGYDLEARTARQSHSRKWRHLKLKAFALFAWALFKFNLKVGDFNPDLYRKDLQANSDFRKFDDGLKLTVDCDPATVDRLHAMLEAAEAAEIAMYGMHRQKSALITCIVPSSVERDHIHFVDGAEGGYARAAENMKNRIREQDQLDASKPGNDQRQHND